MLEQPLYTLITGASSGIGEAFARELAKRKRPMILVARSTEKLHRLAAELWNAHGIDVQVVVQDLSEPDGASRLFEFCQTHRWEVGTLINNAGFGLHGDFLTQPSEKLGEMVRLNIAALINLTHLFLHAMVRRQAGGVLNVSSIAAFQPVPTMAVYAATKAFVLSFSESLHEELRGTGVKVLALCPGATETPFFEAAQMSSATLRTPKETAEAVAQRGIKALEQDRAVAVSGVFNAILVQTARFTPRFLVRKISRWMASGQ